ncbi:MAG: ATP-binding protein [bacterium]
MLQDCDTCGRMAEADHRIANHLAMLGSYVRLRGRNLIRGGMPPDAAEVALVLTAIGVQIAAISDLHHALSADGVGDSPDIAVQLSSVCRAMRSLMPGEIDIVEAIEPGCTLAAALILPVTQLCTEVITNAIKHGRSPDGRARIRVSCNPVSFGAVQIQIADRGRGLPTADPAPVRQGLGHHLIDGLARQSGAEIVYQSTSRGLTVRLTISAAPCAVPARSSSIWHPRNTDDPQESLGIRTAI